MYSMYLTTGKNNPIGRKLYEKLGFVETGKIMDTIGGMKSHEVVMTYFFDKAKIHRDALKEDKKEK